APGKLSIPARALEELGKVRPHSRRKENLLPRCRRSLVALKQRDSLHQAALAAQRVASLEVVPAEEKAHEILRRQRLDLLAQPADGEPVDALEQAAIAPLNSVLRTGENAPWTEAPSQNLPLRLEMAESLADVGLRNTEHARQLERDDRPADFHSPANQRGHCHVPSQRGIARQEAQLRRYGRFGENRLGVRNAFRRDDEGPTIHAQPGCATFPDEKLDE